ncbi:hypothetical protein FXN61_11265 [Lentzea sp. PSKA42]|uniref:Uncharacterized protein n=1 Tax=Lentzea indica TaxID=2604800 RepID=A0ABX1FEJ9_9PSEU|nr:hypothetical protein [Lentzea indica]NKE57384.1 hypothetical protein [Lentzea indica]
MFPLKGAFTGFSGLTSVVRCLLAAGSGHELPVGACSPPVLATVTVMTNVADMERSRAIVGDALLQLCKPIRKERRRQSLRRLTGRSYFFVELPSKEPERVHFAGTGIKPLWETAESEEEDLDSLHPRMVTRRYTIGKMWCLGHQDATRVPIFLIVDQDANAWLVAPDRKKYPATPTGWRRLVTAVEPSYLKHH